MEKIKVCPVCGFVGYAEDAVEVVRCKDCRYFKKIAERSDSGLCYRDLVASAWKENGYCSRGERRKDSEA